MARMRTSHFLFLGYGMRDWNLRVILRHIWSEQTRHFGSWAIQLHPGEIDRRFWERHGGRHRRRRRSRTGSTGCASALAVTRRAGARGRARARAARPTRVSSRTQRRTPDWFFGRDDWREIVVDNLARTGSRCSTARAAWGRARVLNAGVVRQLRADEAPERRRARRSAARRRPSARGARRIPSLR